MSVKYSLASMSTKPGDKANTEKKYYAKAQVAGLHNIDKICKNISHSCTVVRGDVLAVSDGLIHEMIDGLSEGMIVQLGDFGNFQVQVGSEGTATIKEFTSANIRQANIQFRPGPLLVEMLKALKYERVALKADQKKGADAKDPVNPSPTDPVTDPDEDDPNG